MLNGAVGDGLHFGAYARSGGGQGYGSGAVQVSNRRSPGRRAGEVGLFAEKRHDCGQEMAVEVTEVGIGQLIEVKPPNLGCLVSVGRRTA